MLATSIALTGMSYAQDFTFTLFNGANGEDISPILIRGYISQSGTDTELRIANESAGGWVTANQPTVTKIFFEDSSDNFDLPTPVIVGANGTVNFSSAPNHNLPGGTNIYWLGNDSAFTADAPPSHNGIDPGEDLLFRFDDITSSNLLGSLTNGSVRIAIHIQEIDGNASGSFLNETPTGPFLEPPAIPESSVVLLSSLGMILLLRKRTIQ